MQVNPITPKPSTHRNVHDHHGISIALGVGRGADHGHDLGLPGGVTDTLMRSHEIDRKEKQSKGEDPETVFLKISTNTSSLQSYRYNALKHYTAECDLS